MFDVGFSEILLLSLVALLVLGPERLPGVARTLGGLTRKARTSWLSLKRSIEAEMRAEELKKPLENFRKEFKSAVDEVKSGLNQVANPKPGPAPTAADTAAVKPEAVKPEATDPEAAVRPGEKDAG
jgi:sec-independent protein translocase protein TatB